MKTVARLALHWKKLIEIKDPPRAVAIGVAVGVFFGFTPLLGLKTLLAVGTAWFLGGSVVAAVVAVSLHDVLLPIMPFILRWEYDAGYWLLSQPHNLPPALHLTQHQRPGTWLHWSTFLTVGRPLLIGSLFFSGPSALVAFFVTRFFLERAQRWKLGQQAQE
jgi:uncharacterized protein (DUF2062 family)